MGKINWGTIINVLVACISVVAMIGSLLATYMIGYQHGTISASGEYESVIANLLEERVGFLIPSPTPESIVKPTLPPTSRPALPQTASWGGPDLWVVVNEARVENGVNPLTQKDELCTIASIRLNEILELGKLDNHEGFSNMAERREDLKWIFDKYTIAEFLVAGAISPQDAVDLWYNTLGHKKLLTGGEYSYGCTYAQNSFGVAIAAF
ncbi:CAP domain-containing protein [Patescibacteria group bacterium]